MRIRLWLWIVRRLVCRNGDRCGSRGFKLRRREVLKQEESRFLGTPVIVTHLDDRAECLCCGYVHRFRARTLQFINK